MRTLLASAAAGLLLVFAGGAGAQSPTLFGTVGPGFSIRFADASGNPVTHLDPGTYTIQVDDKGDLHNFHLTGPGVDQATDIEPVGTFTWTVTFAEGRYHYQCDAHPTTMRGDFTVGNLPPPSPPAVKPAPPLTLAATVGPAATIAVRTLAGRKVVSVKAGRVVFRVSDRSAKDNFHLAGPGVNRASSRAGKATLVWRLSLRRGLYTYRSDASPRLRGSFRAV
jgi:hypothetical protein